MLNLVHGDSYFCPMEFIICHLPTQRMYQKASSLVAYQSRRQDEINGGGGAGGGQRNLLGGKIVLVVFRGISAILW